MYQPAKESWRTIHVISKPVFDENGDLERFNGLLIDVTEKKKADSALRESEERFRCTFDQVAVGIAHVDTKGRSLWGQRPFLRNFRLHPGGNMRRAIAGPRSPRTISWSAC